MLWAVSAPQQRESWELSFLLTVLNVHQQVETTVTFGLSYWFSGDTVCTPLCLCVFPWGQILCICLFWLSRLSLGFPTLISVSSHTFLAHIFFSLLLTFFPNQCLILLPITSLTSPSLLYFSLHKSFWSDVQSLRLLLLPFPCLWWEHREREFSIHLQPSLLPLLHMPGICALVGSPLPGLF